MLETSMSKHAHKHNQPPKSAKHGEPHAKRDASGKPIGMVKQRASLATILAGIVIVLVLLAIAAFLYFVLFR
jgi:hypothetical protein